MKNLNTGVVVFDNILPNDTNEKNIDLLGISKDIPEVYAKKSADGLIVVPKLDFVLSINAIEKVNSNKNPIHDDGESPENTFFMDEQYTVCLRVTEPHSGNFFDLNTFNINPSEDMIVLCRRIYNRTSVHQYQNVSVAIPPEDKDLFALKVLIRLKDTPGKWIVQSMHPIRAIIDTAIEAK